ncbi:MAG: tRNA preQ1(34) S-adenosylmethionine ribosyltransferase-isomerase QueA [Rhizobiaceae bacterium]
MLVDQFDFDLPEDRIALRPARPRDSARMLVVDPDEPGDGLRDGTVRDLVKVLKPGDAMVFNNTRVIPAQLEGWRERAGATAQIGLTLHMRVSPSAWRAFARGAKKLKEGDRVRFGNQGSACLEGVLEGTIKEKGEVGEVEVEFDLSGVALDEALATVGHIPLPPYIALKRGDDPADREDYQTVYATEDGAVAAPTAGLHFTPELLETIENKGISIHYLTLHVGAGTFLPVKVADTDDHHMHSERGTITKDTADWLNQCRKDGGRILAVGTTSLRLLESAANESGEIKPFDGPTDIFITPGYKFRAVDLLMTNFHLPRSTLFMLVSAFSGLDTIQSAYSHAIETGYRFYSYGDACLLYPRS